MSMQHRIATYREQIETDASKVFVLGLTSEAVERMKSELIEDAEADGAELSGRKFLAFNAFTKEDIDLTQTRFLDTALILCETHWTQAEKERGFARIDEMLAGSSAAVIPD